MKEYITLILYSVISAEILLILLPPGGIRKYVKYAAGLLIMIILISPLKKCGNSLKNIQNGFDDPEKSYFESISDIYNNKLTMMDH